MANVLIIDDDIIQIEIIKNVLIKHGYDVDSATDAQSGIKTTIETMPDIIILDINLPDKSGFEVCKEIKNTPQTTEIPVIFITALEGIDYATQSFECGAVDFIRKPVHANELLARINVHIKLQQTINELRASKDHIAKLEGLLPICCNCKKIRDTNNNWVAVERYFKDQIDTDFTHGICPECKKLLYGK